MVTAVLVYYVTKAFLGDFVRTDLSDKTGQTTYFSWGDFASMTAAWCVVGFLAGLVFGLAGWMAKGGQFSYPFRALVPVVVFAEMTMRLSVESGASAPEVVLTWEVVRAVAVVLGVAVVTWTIWRERRSRTQAGIGN
ncbi:hypothetical protein ACQYWQ_17030 [Streptomyces sp. P6-2-1]|uniref:hypothetical protein n=1 Tax=Streptomyces sp. P6-2-1 TaxID=3422591 RepID=UPI003D35C6DE